jgi:hypothetical protein
MNIESIHPIIIILGLLIGPFILYFALYIAFYLPMLVSLAICFVLVNAGVDPSRLERESYLDAHWLIFVDIAVGILTILAVAYSLGSFWGLVGGALVSVLYFYAVAELSCCSTFPFEIYLRSEKNKKK